MMRKVQEHPTLMFYLCTYLGGKRGVFCRHRVHECNTIVDSGQRETAFQHRGSCGGGGGEGGEGGRERGGEGEGRVKGGGPGRKTTRVRMRI